MSGNRHSWFSTTRRKMLSGAMVGAGALLTGARMSAYGQSLVKYGNVLLGKVPNYPPGFEDAAQFTLMDALYGRRSRRFGMGMEIPDGIFAYKSEKEPMPLDPVEQMLVLTAVAGNTGWHHLIWRNEAYAPKLSNYASAAGGRTFPSPAAWQVVNFFYTDDDGVYYLPTRDAPSLVSIGNRELDLNAWLDAHRGRVQKLADGRLNIPWREPFMDGHNTWVVNRPGTTFVIPVVDNAQMLLNVLAFLISNGYGIFDDINGRQIPGLEKFGDLIDLNNPWPLSVIEQETLTMATAELTTSCYSGALMLQALGLGGWMFSGVDMYSVLGASGDPEVPGLGFRFDMEDGWSVPNVTGLEGVYEGFCPPHMADMRAAVEALEERKYGKGGPFHAETSGPFKDSAKVRSAALGFSDERLIPLLPA